METKIKRILTMLFNANESEINDNFSADNVNQWDSLMQMNIIVAIEEEFGVLFDEEESLLTTSYQSLVEVVENKKNILVCN